MARMAPAIRKFRAKEPVTSIMYPATKGAIAPARLLKDKISHLGQIYCVFSCHKINYKSFRAIIENPTTNIIRVGCM